LILPALGITGNADLRPLAEEVKSRLIRAIGAVESGAPIHEGVTT
jgi:hypothetical protein